MNDIMEDINNIIDLGKDRDSRRYDSSRYDTLFCTIGGSRLFGQQTSQSDYDIMRCYAIPTRDILEGRPYDETLPNIKCTVGNRSYDISQWEIGHLIKYLINGNINMVWSVLSPLTIYNSGVLSRLKEIVHNNLSKVSYHSIDGMAYNQWRDAERRKLGMKAMRSSWRTYNFGIHMMKGDGAIWESAPYIVTDDMLLDMRVELKEVWEDSKLIDVPNKEDFYKILYDIRTYDLMCNGI